jgi:Rrf2 family protein
MPLIGKSVEYALHCLVYLVDKPANVSTGIADLAEFQGVSETYLAKIFARLNHAGIVNASKGLKGGYELAKPAEQISFWSVVSALDSKFQLFRCHNVRASCVLIPKSMKESMLKSGLCTIHHSMLESEQLLIESLKKKNLQWLYSELRKKIPNKDYEKGHQWFAKKSDGRLHA